MACTPADVRLLGTINGDFVDPPYTDAFLQLMIDIAAGVFNADCDIVRGDKLVCALAAHFAIKMTGSGTSGAGQVTAEAAGGLSRSYAAVASGANDGDLSSTTYGNMFILLRDVSSCGIVPLVLKC